MGVGNCRAYDLVKKIFGLNIVLFSIFYKMRNFSLPVLFCPIFPILQNAQFCSPYLKNSDIWSPFSYFDDLTHSLNDMTYNTCLCFRKKEHDEEEETHTVKFNFNFLIYILKIRNNKVLFKL
jgi:hypothetical protein